jgi:hypothetical protein
VLFICLFFTFVFSFSYQHAKDLFLLAICLFLIIYHTVSQPCLVNLNSSFIKYADLPCSATLKLLFQLVFF